MKSTGRALYNSISVPFNSRNEPDFYFRKMPLEILKMFDQHQWRGLLGGMGHGKRLPLLTRLGGGMLAWQGKIARKKKSDT